MAPHLPVDGSYSSRSSRAADIIARQAPGTRGTDDANPVDWDEVFATTKNTPSNPSAFLSSGGSGDSGSSSIKARGPPASPPNFGCFACVTRDNDARLIYNGSWSLNASPSATTHSTTEQGASVSFRFNGSGIIVFGTVPQSNETLKPPVASYFLDANKPMVTTEPMANSNVPNQPLFFAGQLSADEHQLTIQVGSNNGLRTAPYILQNFFVSPRSNVTQHVVDALPTSALHSPPRSTSTTTSTAAASSLPKAPPPATSSAATIRVLAGTLGSLIALIVLVGLFFVFRRRRWRHDVVMLPQLRKTKSTYSSASSTTGVQEGTILTSTESILRNDPSGIFSLYTRSERGRGSVVDYYLSLPLPLPDPLPIGRKSLPPTPPPRLPPKS